jgi:hypothetical protein
LPREKRIEKVGKEPPVRGTRRVATSGDARCYAAEPIDDQMITPRTKCPSSFVLRNHVNTVNSGEPKPATSEL